MESQRKVSLFGYAVYREMFAFFERNLATGVLSTGNLWFCGPNNSNKSDHLSAWYKYMLPRPKVHYEILLAKFERNHKKVSKTGGPSRIRRVISLPAMKHESNDTREL